MKIIDKIKHKKQNNKFNSFLNKKMTIFILMVLFLVVGLMYTSYALFFSVKETNTDTVTFGDLEVTYSEGTGTIVREDEQPLTDQEGNETNPYTVTITNTGTLRATCTMLLTTDTDYLTTNSLTAVADTEMKYSINKSRVGIVSTLSSNTLHTFVLEPGDAITYDLRFWLKSDAPNTAIGKAFVKKLQVRAQYVPVSKNHYAFAKLLRTNNPPTNPTTTPGREVATTDEGLIKGQADDDGVTYYFRGTAPDNYVTFAGLTWRVVRINGDGSVRLVLNTTTGTDSAWNTNYSSTTWSTALSYATYANSTIKGSVETWYNTNIGNNTNYSSKVVESKFCNDRTYTTGTTYYYFGAYNRISPDWSVASAEPSYICPDSTHIYNLNVGLLTADEVAFAGGAYGTNNQSYYLYKSGTNWWTLSPYYWYVSTGTVRAWYVNNSDSLNYFSLHYSYGVVPVISLSSDISVSTASPTNPGTTSNPYIVQ